MTTKSSIVPIEIMPGVMPSTDATPSDIPCWADALHIRFDPTTGRVRKLGGWVANIFDYGATITGIVRSIYSATINGVVYTILGSNSKLYALQGSDLTNITPLKASTVAVANSLDTDYFTLASNAISTVSGISTVTVAGGTAYSPGDIVKLAGATAFNGLGTGDLNAEHVVHTSVGTTWTYISATIPNATGSGGGASIVQSSGLIEVEATAHGMSNGDRVKITGAANTGGILAAEINKEYIIRLVGTDFFFIVTGGIATSLVTHGGGASTKYQEEIDPGNVNQSFGQGYGVGKYGVGLYGTALLSSSAQTYPRIWFIDRYGNNLIMTPGNQTGVYQWDGDTTEAPVLVTNAPTTINYAFVQSNILATFGHTTENNIFASDIGDITNWTASSSNQVFEDAQEGAGALISHVAIDGGSLFWSENQTYIFTYLGLPDVWDINQLDPTIGIIAPMARVSVNGYAYWMGQNNFYTYQGGKIQVIPSNFGLQSSILQYVFSDLNWGQRFKIFAWHNEQWDEIWWHYPSSQSNECDRVARFSRKLQCWVPDMLDRSAGEYPNITLQTPRLANGTLIYAHEIGANDDTSPMAWSARTNKGITGDKTAVMSQIIPDSAQTGAISAEFRTWLYPQSATSMNDNAYTIQPTTEKVPVQLNGRFWDLTFSGDELDQTFLMGQWYIEPQAAGRAP